MPSLGLTPHRQNCISIRKAHLIQTKPTVDRSAHHDHQQTTKMGRPYLDENGSICQDKMEMMEHVEYDKQIMCKVLQQKNPLHFMQFLNSLCFDRVNFLVMFQHNFEYNIKVFLYK